MIQDGNVTAIAVALEIAVGEPRCGFSQVALSDWLAAQRTERWWSGCPVIHQDEFHVPPPNEKPIILVDHVRPCTPDTDKFRYFPSRAANIG